jgi:hypothetical protein
MNEDRKRIKEKLLLNPDDFNTFNVARLLIVFEVLKFDFKSDGIGLERLSYYDFFAANPFLLTITDFEMKRELEYIGFETITIGYLSSSQRYRTKRASLKQYLAILVSKRLIRISNQNGRLLYQITDFGVLQSKQLTSLYAIAYRKSLKIIINKFKGYSDKKLWDEASNLLEAQSFQVDLFEMRGDGHE